MGFPTVKRMKRNPEKFEVIDLYTTLGRENGYKLSVDEDLDNFISRVKDSLKASFDNKNLLHGKRVEALFAHVAGALGQCQLIKQEDSGNLFSDGNDIQAPDYVLVLKDGQRIFVEVKNCHFSNPKSPYPFRKDYVERLEKYAELNGAPLKFAIYFSFFNKWLLVSKESLIEQHRRYVATFLHSTAMNEMAILGDRMIGVKPPLSVVLVADRDKPAFVDENAQAQFIISDVKLYCDGVEILDKTEKDIAFYLVRFGNFLESECKAFYDGEELRGVKFDYAPESPSEEQIFSMIGDLSSMVSSSYSDHTVNDRKLVALDTKADPEIFSVYIPDSYHGEHLPLWQFIMQPNPDFKVDV